MDTVEHTLFVCREVNVFKIPPRPAAGGHKSGEWKVADKIFTGRLRVTAMGEACDLRLEDANSGELFGVCPVAQGQRAVAVEPVADSSRYFVLRLLDKSSGRHAFVGLGFNDRGEAFDFNVALSDHEKQAHRASAADPLVAGATGPSWASKEIAALDTGKDFSLKQGETIRVNVKKPPGTSTGFLTQMGTSSGLPVAGIPAPPGGGAAPPRISPRSDLPSPALSKAQSQQQQHHPQVSGAARASTIPQQQQNAQDPFMTDLLGLAAPAPAASQQKSTGLPAQVNKVPDSWASFD